MHPRTETAESFITCSFSNARPEHLFWKEGEKIKKSLSSSTQQGTNIGYLLSYALAISHDIIDPGILKKKKKVVRVRILRCPSMSITKATNGNILKVHAEN